MPLRLRRDFKDIAGFSTRNQLTAASGRVAMAAMIVEHNRIQTGKPTDDQQLLNRERVNVHAVGQIRP
jgi:hypothetical protein